MTQIDQIHDELSSKKDDVQGKKLKKDEADKLATILSSLASPKSVREILSGT